MTQGVVPAAEELEGLGKLKARYISGSNGD
jgi:hypothetical protein